MYCLQSRWKLEGNRLYYYGLRNRGEMFQNAVRLSKKQRGIIAALPKELDKSEKAALKGLLGRQVVPQVRSTQDSRKPFRSALLHVLLRQRFHSSRTGV